MPRQHKYDVTVSWTGNTGTGTSGHRAFSRDHEVSADGPPTIAGSADPALGGDPGRWNPEQALTASLSQCHMLWYLHLCADAGVVVTEYVDHTHGEMQEHRGGGHFTEVELRPQVTVTSPEMIDQAQALHHTAHERCFIANSVNFPVRCTPMVTALTTSSPG